MDKERLDIEVLDKSKCDEEGFVYVFVVNEKIFKIGQSTTNIIKRIQSYNCGKAQYRKNGTCGTTNYFVLQSLLNLNLEVFVYAFFPQKPRYEIFGQVFEDSYPPSKKSRKYHHHRFYQKARQKAYRMHTDLIYKQHKQSPKTNIHHSSTDMREVSDNSAWI